MKKLLSNIERITLVNAEYNGWNGFTFELLSVEYGTHPPYSLLSIGYAAGSYFRVEILGTVFAYDPTV